MITYIPFSVQSQTVCLFLNANCQLKLSLEEMYFSYDLLNLDGKKILHLTLGNCCAGPNAFWSHRTFSFTKQRAILQENHILTREVTKRKKSTHHYLESSPEEVTPLFYHSNPYFVRLLTQNYNLRTPTTDPIELLGSVSEAPDNVRAALEDGTNIIGKINANSPFKVLSEKIGNNSAWLFVEVSPNDLNFKVSNPTTNQGDDNRSLFDFGFEDKNLRAWASDKFVKRE